MRQRWDIESHSGQPRIGDIYQLRFNDATLTLSVARRGVLLRRCRRSAAVQYAPHYPNADALGYVDCAAPRLKMRRFPRSVRPRPGLQRRHNTTFRAPHEHHQPAARAVTRPSTKTLALSRAFA